MPSTFPYPELHISLSRGRRKRWQQFSLVRKPKSKKRDLREQTEELSYALILKIHKTQVSEYGRLRNLKFKPFQVSIIKVKLGRHLKVHKSGRSLE